jgi:hypothetical protein
MAICSDVVYSDGKNWYMNCSDVLTLNIGKVIRKNKMSNTILGVIIFVVLFSLAVFFWSKNEIFEFFKRK